MPQLCDFTAVGSLLFETPFFLNADTTPKERKKNLKKFKASPKYFSHKI